MYLHTLTMTHSMTEPGETLYFQLTVLRSSWYHPATMSWLKRLQDCGRMVLQLPTATHLHGADHH